jgi:hypothetical protein
MEEAAWSYVNFVMRRSRLVASDDMTIMEQVQAQIEFEANFNSLTGLNPVYGLMPITPQRRLENALYNESAGGMILSPENLNIINRAYDNMFASCMEKLTTTSPTPEEPVRYLCEVANGGRYFYEDYLLMKEYFREISNPLASFRRNTNPLYQYQG